MTQIAKKEDQSVVKYKTVFNLLNSDMVVGQIKRALPNHMTPERMIRVALTAIQKTPKLAECEQRSLIGAIVQASELGLEPNTPLGHCYLIPYWNSTSKQNEAQLQIGYRGFIALARRSGEISSVSAEIVYSKDEFYVGYGTDRKLLHVPLLNNPERGEPLGAYAVVVFKDGFTDFEYMDSVQIGKIRARSKSGDSGPWKTDTDEMWRKTPIRRLAKRLPLAIQDSDLLKAAVHDEYTDLGFGEMVPVELPPASQVITEEQRVALVNLATEKGISGEQLSQLVTEEGFEMLAHITQDRYADIVTKLTNPPAAVEKSGEQSASEPEKTEEPSKTKKPKNEAPESVAKAVDISTKLQKEYDVSFDDLATQFLPEGTAKFSELTEEQAAEAVPGLVELLNAKLAERKAA
jgi:recombination protein RecT